MDYVLYRCCSKGYNARQCTHDTNITDPVSFMKLNQVAQNVQGIIVPNTRYWIPKEQPQFVIDQPSRFFGNSTNTVTTTSSIIPPASSPNSTTGNTTALDHRTAHRWGIS
jgi:hypothetical protein